MTGFEKFVPMVNTGISHNDPEYRVPGARPRQLKFYHSRIRTIDNEIVYSTWMGGKGMGILTWFSYEDGRGSDYTQALVSIKIMQAWFGLYDAVVSVRNSSVDRDPGEFDIDLRIPVIMLDNGEVDTFEFGSVEDVLGGGTAIEAMLIQPENSRFVPLMSTKCCSCNEDMGVNSPDLGGLNEGTWSPIRINGDSKWGYQPYCTSCSEAIETEVVQMRTRAGRE